MLREVYGLRFWGLLGHLFGGRAVFGVPQNPTFSDIPDFPCGYEIFFVTLHYEKNPYIFLEEWGAEKSGAEAPKTGGGDEKIFSSGQKIIFLGTF